MTASFSCKSWRCQGCGPIKKKNWVASITHRLQSWPRVRFWTLTLNPALVPNGIAPERFIQRAWRNVRAELARAGTPLSFVWVLEYTKKGVPHLHVAVNRYVKRSWLQKHWIRLTGAWNVDVRAVEAENVTTYLAKYMGKTLDTLQGMKRSKGDVLRAKGLHIYGTSKDMTPFAPHVANPEWELIKVPEDIEALLTPRPSSSRGPSVSAKRGPRTAIPATIEAPPLRTAKKGILSGSVEGVALVRRLAEEECKKRDGLQSYTKPRRRRR